MSPLWNTSSPEDESTKSIFTPKFCFSTVALQDFLRMQRALDDNIIHSLNNLHTVSSLNKSYPKTIDSSQTSSPSKKRISSESCYDFKNKALFPSWKVRDDILVYCASVATNTDTNESGTSSLLADDRERIVDERLDPYSGRAYPIESKAEKLTEIIRQEKEVERIIRDRSWRLIHDKCGEDWRTWEDSLNMWKQASIRHTS